MRLERINPRDNGHRSSVNERSSNVTIIINNEMPSASSNARGAKRKWSKTSKFESGVFLGLKAIVVFLVAMVVIAYTFLKACWESK